MEIRFTSEIFNHLLQSEENIACAIEGQTYTYGEFSNCVGAAQQRMLGISEPAVGVLVQNSMETYAALVAAWLCGKAYVPINANYPEERNAIIFREAGVRHLFYAENDEISRLEAHDLHFIDTKALTPQKPVFIEPGAEKTAYILFTSGTTGSPKGVSVTFGNLQAFCEGFLYLDYELNAKDRFLQMFELTFDLSVMCFMIPLTLGASFYTLPAGMIKTLGLYHILESMEITFSLMVPSAIQMLMPYLEDIHLPQLRVSQFCGEALKLDVVEKWSRCVPNAVVDNVYGPTEATIYCTTQRLVPEQKEIAGFNGVAGIGKAMLHVQTAVYQEGKKVIETGIAGELCLSGAQLSPGYLNNPTQNEKAFFEDAGIRYYKTGDLVFMNEENNLMYSG
ncbi:MAG: AMP-binding protein, partial [Bacteroidetes bacterium]|nr:AMP-binding protein [Bacteroidota bacterium]